MDLDDDLSDLRECWDLLHPRPYQPLHDSFEVGLKLESGVEVSAPEYMRIRVHSFDQIHTVTFPVATSNWGTVTHAVLFAPGTNQSFLEIPFASKHPLTENTTLSAQIAIESASRLSAPRLSAVTFR